MGIVLSTFSRIGRTVWRWVRKRLLRYLWTVVFKGARGSGTDRWRSSFFRVVFFFLWWPATYHTFVEVAHLGQLAFLRKNCSVQGHRPA